MIEGEIGPNMWKECLTTVSRRSFCITVQGSTEADQRKDGRRATTPEADKQTRVSI